MPSVTRGRGGTEPYVPKRDPRTVARQRLQNLSSGTTALYLYSEIGDSWWGDSVSAKDFVAELQAVETDRIEMHINSPGGDVWDGLAILNALRAHPAAVTTVIDGIAASAASFIAMAGEEVVMMANAELMIHDASGVALGDAALMRQMAEDLDRESDNIADVYARKAGGTAAEWRDRMRVETWFSAEEAVSAGLADRIQDGPPAEEPKTSKILGAGSDSMDDWWWDALPYRYAGRSEAPAPLTRGRRTARRSDRRDRTVPLRDEIAKRLGVRNEDVSDEDLLEALDEALEEGEDGREGEPGGAPGDPEVTGQPENHGPDGTVTVDSATWDSVQRDAKAGRDARAQQQEEHRQHLVSAAIRDGRIPAARKTHWIEALVKDPEGNEAALASLAKGLIPVNERGHDSGPDSETQDPGQPVNLAVIRGSDTYKRAWHQ
jgi:ATP-dependent protease ClpP protease subunit